MIAQMTRFLGIGGLATLVHVTAALLGRELLALSEVMANGLGWLAAVTISYFGHLRITFRVDPEHTAQLPRFLFMSVGGLLVSSGAVALVTMAGGDFIFAMGSVAVLVPMASYILMQIWVFADHENTKPLISVETATAAVVALAVLLAFWGQQMNHDVIWYHVATRKWLAGAALYTDIVEVNPPLAFYFTLPVIKLADLTGLNDQAAQLILIAGLTFVSLSLTGRALARTGKFTSHQRAIVIAGTGAILIALTLRDIAQREHIFVLLFLPWIAETIDSNRNPSPGFTLLAAVGMCLKPFFVIFPLFALLLWAVRKRSIAPLFSLSAFIFLITGLAYIGAVALLHPVYFTEIMPTAALVYGAYGAPLWPVTLFVLIPLTALVCAGLWIMTRPSPPLGTTTFFTVTLAGSLSYFIQSTGFFYHTIPFLAFGSIACVFALFDARCRVFALVALVLVANYSLNKGRYIDGVSPLIGRIIEQQPEIGSLLVLTTDVAAGPIVAAGAGVDWANEYPAQWLIPGALNARVRANCSADPQRCEDIDAILDRNRNDLLRDIQNGRPDMIVFDQANLFFDVPFAWQDFLAHEHSFTEIMKRYRRIEHDDRFSYWKRINSN
ncbi:MAG: GtrA family protein [Yoonia sp.]|uniref:GtrA family protein n=1 Tax=Yoonia sp. TaxID=2212373 RepID=UPI003EF3D4BA